MKNLLFVFAVAALFVSLGTSSYAAFPIKSNKNGAEPVVTATTTNDAVIAPAPRGDREGGGSPALGLTALLCAAGAIVGGIIGWGAIASAEIDANNSTVYGDSTAATGGTIAELVLGIAAIVTGAMGMRSKYSGRGMAITGMVLGILNVIAGFIGAIVALVLFSV
jgi:hypothetical protein